MPTAEPIYELEMSTFRVEKQWGVRERASLSGMMV